MTYVADAPKPDMQSLAQSPQPDTGTPNVALATLGPGTGSGASSIHFSSKSNEWSTPQDFFDRCNAEFGFTLDPCSTHTNAKCPKHYTLADDGLAQDWGHERVWMNPPYAREIGHWMRKAWLSSQAGALVVCLIPARTDTRWWHEWAMKGEIRFIRGRLKFGGAKFNAPFPVALVIMRPPNIPVRDGEDRASHSHAT